MNAAKSATRNEGKNYRYIQLFTEAGVGHACIYLEWKKNGTEIVYTAGLSFCSPKDQFEKDLARTIAHERFVKGRSKRIAGKISASDSTKTFVSIPEAENLLRDALNVAMHTSVPMKDPGGSGSDTTQLHSLVPNWAQRAIRNNDYKFGLTQDHSKEGK